MGCFWDGAIAQADSGRTPTGSPFDTEVDPAGDIVVRPTDPGGTGLFNPIDHRLIDLLEKTIGSWAPTAPATDLFAGSFSTGGPFLRLDLVLAGLVNPPGSVNPLQFDPFAYGDHPVYGFVEIDMDHNENTGGELDAPQYRFLGNIARFGGVPSDDEFDLRVAKDASAFDGDFLTPPFVERHGEEFHLALLGDHLNAAGITEVVGDGDALFDAGETWDVRGYWFHRAHGFEPFSLATGGTVAGEYAPMSLLRFHHDPIGDKTTVSLVFPLTNTAAAGMRNESVQPDNGDPSDQASVLEALWDLVDSAAFTNWFSAGLAEEAIILPWENEDPTDFLDPTGWEVSVLLGSSYIAPHPAGEFFVWTDTYPNVVRGDVTGDDLRDSADKWEINHFIVSNDASDGNMDGRVVITNFPENFSVFDINQDGVVDGIDGLLVSMPGDSDGDDDVDLADFARLQNCFSGRGGNYPYASCSLEDFDGDGYVDLFDAGRFQAMMTGP